MATTLVNFSSVTARDLTNLQTGLAVTRSFTLRILPQVGTGANGGTTEEAAKPVLEAMLDASGNLLAQYVRVYRVTQGGQEISGTDVALSARLLSTPFSNGFPTSAVYFDLVVTPTTPLLGTTGYALDYTNYLPAQWLPKAQLVYTTPIATPSDTGILTDGN